MAVGDRRVEAAARALWPGTFIAGAHPDIAAVARERAAGALAAADEAEPSFPATWDGLLAFLDVQYPEAVITGESGDWGPKLVVIARETAKARGRADRAERAARKLAEALYHALGALPEYDPAREQA